MWYKNQKHLKFRSKTKFKLYVFNLELVISFLILFNPFIVKKNPKFFSMFEWLPDPRTL
jgi:hypothetical protein